MATNEPAAPFNNMSVLKVTSHLDRFHRVNMATSGQRRTGLKPMLNYKELYNVDFSSCLSATKVLFLSWYGPLLMSVAVHAALLQFHIIYHRWCCFIRFIIEEMFNYFQDELSNIKAKHQIQPAFNPNVTCSTPEWRTLRMVSCH